MDDAKLKFIFRETIDLKPVRNNFPDKIYLFKANNENKRTMYEICSKLIIRTIERRQ